jgi:hypothetical protein
MYKFKALLKKDLQISKKTLIMPVWIVLAYYILLALGILIAYIKTGLSFDITNLDLSNSPSLNILSYIVGIGIMSFPSILAVIFTLILTQSSLNEDLRRGSELFHRSQPISVWFRSLSKFVSGIAGNWLTFLAIGVLNIILAGIGLLIVDQLRVDFLLAGWLQAFVGMMKITLIIGSICFFFSAIFRDKAFLQGFAILVGIQFLLWILNQLLGWHLPLPINYLYKLIYPVVSFTKMESYVTDQDVRYLINRNWQDLIFTWQNLLQILFSGILFALSTLIYKGKEIK